MATVVATVSEDRDQSDALARRGARVWRFERDESGRVPLRLLFKRLAEEGELSILVEGGPTVHTALLREGLSAAVIAPVRFLTVLMGSFAAIALLTVLSIALFHGVEFIERRVVDWTP